MKNSITAPPSAPVGVEEKLRKVLGACRKLSAMLPDGAHREHMATISGQVAMAAEALAQQPAAVDRRHPYVQSKDHGGCANCGYPEWEPWHALATQHQEPTT